MNETVKTLETSDASQLPPEPLVSVLMITYNHADYLADAIEGVVAQRCSFPIELLIGEDASTDGTLEVALRYQKRFPQLIRVIHAETNVGMMANSKRLLARARGRYLAYCEGDDYWCRADKLERQVALMESDPRIGVVHADWTRSRWVDGAWHCRTGWSMHERVPSALLTGDLGMTWHYPKVLRSCTVLRRRDIALELAGCVLGQNEYRFGDSVYNAFVTRRWRVAYLPVVASVYRLSPHSALRSGAQSRVRFYYSALRFDTDARTYFRGRSTYGSGFRWETGVGLLLWALRAHDKTGARDALRDLWHNYHVFAFLREAWRALYLRRPTWRRQVREPPNLPLPPSAGSRSR